MFLATGFSSSLVTDISSVRITTTPMMKQTILTAKQWSIKQTILLCQAWSCRPPHIVLLIQTTFEFKSNEKRVFEFKKASSEWVGHYIGRSCRLFPEPSHLLSMWETYRPLKIETCKWGGRHTRAHRHSFASQAGCVCSGAHCCSAEPWFHDLRESGGGSIKGHGESFTMTPSNNTDVTSTVETSE